MALMQLIYASSAREPLAPGELHRILDAAVRGNEPLGVTGMLLYISGSFLQVLEGEPSAVDEIFGRIEQDPRHKDIFVIARGPIEARSFGRWSMGFRHLGREDAPQHPAFAPIFSDGFTPETVGATPGMALDILMNFAATVR